MRTRSTYSRKTHGQVILFMFMGNNLLSHGTPRNGCCKQMICRFLDGILHCTAQASRSQRGGTQTEQPAWSHEQV